MPQVQSFPPKPEGAAPRPAEVTVALTSDKASRAAETSVMLKSNNLQEILKKGTPSLQENSSKNTIELAQEQVQPSDDQEQDSLNSKTPRTGLIVTEGPLSGATVCPKVRDGAYTPDDDQEQAGLLGSLQMQESFTDLGGMEVTKTPRTGLIITKGPLSGATGRIRRRWRGVTRDHLIHGSCFDFEQCQG